MKRIPVAGPSITQKEVDAVADAVRHAWYEDANLYHQRFESAFAEYLGSRFAMALPSCTSAIHLSLAAFGVGPGDEVIVPEVTWIASAAPVSYLGATPVFADIDPDTWCLSANSVEECLTPRTRAIISVDLYGNLPDMERLRTLADQQGLALIEDAAQAVGSTYQGRKAGSLGTTGTFSFHGSKTLTTGEGGMLVTDSEKLLRRASFLRDHGREPGDRLFFNTEVAYKYRMSAMQAALGLAQLERLDELLAHKRRIFSWYAHELEGLGGLRLNQPGPQVDSSYWMVTVLLEPALGLRKEELMRRLDAHGIDTRPFFHPLSSLPAYAGLEQSRRARQRNQVSYRLSPYGVNLPSGLNMTQALVAEVCGALKAILWEHSRRGA